MNDFYGPGSSPNQPRANKHRQFLDSLVKLKLPPAVIEKRWQEYYNQLNLVEKKQVWQLVDATNKPQPTPAPLTSKPNLNQPSTTTQAATPNQISPKSPFRPTTTQPSSTTNSPSLVGATLQSPPTSKQSPLYPQPRIKKELSPLQLAPKNQPVEAQSSIDKPSFWRQFQTNFQVGIGAIFPRLVKDTGQAVVESRTSHNLKSIMYGILSAGIIWIGYQLVYYNQRYVLPFITPGDTTNVQVIVTPEATAGSQEPSLIIPSLGVQLPVVYGEPFIKTSETAADFENRMQEALKNGVVHYPGTQEPGITGADFNSNFVVIGHSSGNIFASGDYLYAFVDLHLLEKGDLFIANYQGTQYIYKIYEKRVILPTDVEVLGAAPKPNSATLITCYPPDKNSHRIIVIGEQISPDPAVSDPTSRLVNTKKLQDHNIPGYAPGLFD